MIRYSEQSIDHEDISNVIKTLKSDLITTGPKILKFEKDLSNKVNSKYCVVFNSATSALHSACLALGLKKMIGYGHQQTVLLHQQIVDYIVELKLTLLI